MKNDTYKQLLEDIKGLLIEGGFVTRMSRIEVYHTLGGRIVEDGAYRKHKKGNKELIQKLSSDLKISRRLIYYGIGFYKKFPDLALLPEGKDLSWSRIVEKYLTKSKEKVKRPLFCDVCQKSYEHTCKTE